MRLPESALFHDDELGVAARPQCCDFRSERDGESHAVGCGIMRMIGARAYSVTICNGSELWSADMTRQQFSEFLADGLALLGAEVPDGKP